MLLELIQLVSSSTATSQVRKSERPRQGSRTWEAYNRLTWVKTFNMGLVIPKQNRKAIYEALFSEGCLVAPKDFELPQHPTVKGVTNLEVIKSMQSLTSKGFVKTQYNWRWFYYTMTESGLEYLREWLHIPVEIVPNTHKVTARASGPPRSSAGRGGFGGPRSDDAGYRRRDGAKDDAPGDFQPQFRGGFGRGQPATA